MGGKGSSGGNDALDYFGTCAVAIGAGPLDYLWMIESNGKEAWPAAEVWASLVSIPQFGLRKHLGRTWKAKVAHNSAEGNQPPNPTYWEPYMLFREGDISTDLTVPNYGEATIYWGTDLQTPDPVLQPKSVGNPTGHEMPDENPAMIHTAYVVFKGWFLGREIDAVGNLRFGVGRKPQQSFIGGAPADLVDGQANPACCLVEVLTNPIDGLKQPLARLDTTSWENVANRFWLSNETAYLSPIIDSATRAKEFVSKLSDLLDLWLRYDPTFQRLEIGVWLHGAPSAPLAIIGRDYWAKDGLPDLDGGDSADWITTLWVKFRDRDRRYKAGLEPLPNPQAFRILGEHNELTLSADWITRRTQAASYGAEYLRSIGRPQGTCTVVLKPFWRGLTPVGATVQVDVDSTPGGLQLLQNYRVTSRSIAYDGLVTANLEADETQSPVPFTPAADVPPVIAPSVVLAIPNQRLIQAPQRLAEGENYRVIVLAERPDLVSAGFLIHFSLTSAGVYQSLASQTGWAIRATLRADFSDTSAAAIQITVPAQADTELLASSPSPNEAADNTFLCFLVKVAAGQVDENAQGYPLFEICSISQIAKVSSNGYDLTVDRERLGSTRQSCVVATTEVWIIRRSSLVFAQHEAFQTIGEQRFANGLGEGYFKLQPYTLSNSRPLADCATVTLRFPKRMLSAPQLTWVQPAWRTQTYATPPGNITIEGTWRDADSNLSAIEVTVRLGGGEEVILATKSFQLVAEGYFKVTYNFSVAGTYVVTARARDITGLVGEDSLSIEVQGGTPTVATPYFGTWGDQILGTLSNRNWTFDSRIFAFCQTPGATLEWNVSDFGGAPPGSGWVAVASGGILNGLANFSSWRFKRHRIHLRGFKSGLAASVVAYCDMG